MGLFRAAHGWEEAKNVTLSQNLSHISYNDETLHGYTVLLKIQKHMNHATQPLSSAVITIFSLEISNFCDIKKYRYRLHYNT